MMLLHGAPRGWERVLNWLYRAAGGKTKRANVRGAVFATTSTVYGLRGAEGCSSIKVQMLGF